MACQASQIYLHISYMDIGILRGLCNQNIAVLSHILLGKIMQNSNIWSWNEYLTCHCIENIKNNILLLLFLTSYVVVFW